MRQTNQFLDDLKGKKYKYMGREIEVLCGKNGVAWILRDNQRGSIWECKDFAVREMIEVSQ